MFHIENHLHCVYGGRWSYATNDSFTQLVGKPEFMYTESNQNMESKSMTDSWIR